MNDIVRICATKVVATSTVGTSTVMVPLVAGPSRLAHDGGKRATNLRVGQSVLAQGRDRLTQRRRRLGAEVDLRALPAFGVHERSMTPSHLDDAITLEQSIGLGDGIG